jgi:hypothetical protein
MTASCDTLKRFQYEKTSGLSDFDVVTCTHFSILGTNCGIRKYIEESRQTREPKISKAMPRPVAAVVSKCTSRPSQSASICRQISLSSKALPLQIIVISSFLQQFVPLIFDVVECRSSMIELIRSITLSKHAFTSCELLVSLVMPIIAPYLNVREKFHCYLKTKRIRIAQTYLWLHFGTRYFFLH